MPININKRSDVNSVNGKVGDVVLNASDIGALSKDTKIPTKTSELINDSNYVLDANYVHTDNNYTNEDKNKLNNIANGTEVNSITGIKGDFETEYRTGNVNITKANIGLGNVDNTADADKSVKNADKLYNKSNDYYGVWLGGMTIPKGTVAGMSQSVAKDPLHRYIKPTSIIDIYYDDNSVQYASEIGMLYNIWESGGIYYLSVAPKKDVVKQDIVIQNILVRNP